MKRNLKKFPPPSKMINYFVPECSSVSVCKQMAVLDFNDDGWLVSHERFINEIYNKTKSNGKEICFNFNPVLFEFNEPSKSNKNQNENGDEEVELVKAGYQSLYSLFIANKLNLEGRVGDYQDGRGLARLIHNSTSSDTDFSFWGGNDDEAVLAVVRGEKYLIPKNCRFYSYDIKCLNYFLKNELFHFILIDPPWWNKSVRRKRKANAGYNMLYDDDLLSIPVNDLLHDDGIVGVWCTSAPSHINAVITKLFPAWNLKFLCQWFWLKVTKNGKPVCKFSKVNGKQPYERIIFGLMNNSKRGYKNPENNKIIMSIPSAIHSHKPPLCELIKPYIPENSKCLELFSRYLLPNWTSFGNEVLKLQHISLYTEIPEIPEIPNGTHNPNSSSF